MLLYFKSTKTNVKKCGNIVSLCKFEKKRSLLNNTINCYRGKTKYEFRVNSVILKQYY